MTAERPPIRDERPILRIAPATWAREDQAVLRQVAAELGYRLVVTDDDGAGASLSDDPEGW